MLDGACATIALPGGGDARGVLGDAACCARVQAMLAALAKALREG